MSLSSPKIFAATFLTAVETGLKDIDLPAEYASDPRAAKIGRAVERLGVHEVRILGAGSFGTAAVYRDDAAGASRVVKLTADETEVLAGSVLTSVSLPHVAQIYGSWFVRGVHVERWDSPRQERVGVLLQERLSPVTRGEAQPITDAWSEIRSLWRLHPNELAALPKREARQRLYDASSKLENRLRMIGLPMARDIADALRELRDIGVYSIDVHGGNIGRSGDQFKLFDVGSSSSPAHAEAPEVHGEAAEARKAQETAAQTPYVVMEGVSVEEVGDDDVPSDPGERYRATQRAYSELGPYTLDQSILKYQGQKVGELSIGRNGNTIDVARIFIDRPLRGQGHARRAMEQLNEFADVQGLTIVLSPGPDWGASVPRLKRFYKSLGFVDNRGRKIDYAISADMYRLPRGGAAEDGDATARAVERVRAQPTVQAFFPDGVVVQMPLDPNARPRAQWATRHEYPVQRVRVADLVARQQVVGREKVVEYLTNGWNEPIMVEMRGDSTALIVDGHHRAYAAYLRGDEYVDAYVVPMGQEVASSMAREGMRASDQGHIERSYDLSGCRTSHQVVVGQYIVMVTVQDGEVAYSEVYEGLLREPARPCVESRKAEYRARAVVRERSGVDLAVREPRQAREAPRARTETLSPLPFALVRHGHDVVPTLIVDNDRDEMVGVDVRGRTLSFGAEEIVGLVNAEPAAVYYGVRVDAESAAMPMAAEAGRSLQSVDELRHVYNGAGSYMVHANDLLLDGTKIGELWLTMGGGYDGPTNARVVEVQKISIDGAYEHKGHARAAMMQLVRVADERGLTIKLEPVDYMGANKARLAKFYESLGFVKYAGRNQMRRRPGAAEEAGQPGVKKGDTILRFPGIKARKGMSFTVKPRGQRFQWTPEKPRGLTAFPEVKKVLMKQREGVPSLESIRMAAIFAGLTVHAGTEEAEETFGLVVAKYKSMHGSFPPVEHIQDILKRHLPSARAAMYETVLPWSTLVQDAMKRGLRDRELRRHIWVDLEGDQQVESIGLAKMSFAFMLMGQNLMCLDTWMLGAAFADKPFDPDNPQDAAIRRRAVGDRISKQWPWSKAKSGRELALKRYEQVEDAILKGNPFHDPTSPIDLAQCQWESWQWALGGMPVTHRPWIEVTKEILAKQTEWDFQRVEAPF